MKKLQSPLGLILSYVMLFAAVAWSTGCPKKDAVRTAVDASYRLPATTNDIIRQVTTARDKHIITPDQAVKFGTLLNQMATAETVYVGLVKSLVAAMNTNGGVADPGKLGALRLFFDEKVVGPFLQVLELTKVLSGDSVNLILLAVSAARLLIRTIGGGIGSTIAANLVAFNVQTLGKEFA
jgi:hypothetical protein